MESIFSVKYLRSSTECRNMTELALSGRNKTVSDPQRETREGM